MALNFSSSVDPDLPCGGLRAKRRFYAKTRRFTLDGQPGDDEFIVRPPNLTPDKDTGIGAWDKATFLAAIRGRALLIGQSVPFGEPNNIMPYRELARMTDQDLGAIYDYLRTLPPVKNKVTRFEKL